MKHRHLAFAALLAVSLAALAACNDAIYATIDTEKKTATNTLSQTISVFDIAVSPAGTYYVASGAIFKGTLSGSTVSWTPNASDNTRPWNPTGLICNAMALFGPNLYGGFISQGGTPSLYQSTVSPFTFSSGTPLGMPATGEQVTGLGADATNLFVSGATLSGSSFVYRLDYATTPGTWLATNLVNQTYPILGVVSDGVRYWTATGSSLYVATAGTFAGTLAAPPAGVSGTITGLFGDTTTGTVFVMTKSSGVYYSSNGGTSWSHIGADVVGTATVSYLSAAGPIDGGGDKYLIGSDGFGYYVLSKSGGTMSRYGDSTIALYSASVSRIVLDTANKVVLMGTNAKGLWRSVYDASGNLPASGQSWINE